MSIGINNEFVKADIIGGSGDSGASAKSTVTVTNFSQADLGDNPAINLATGRLRYSFKDLEVGHGNFAVGVSHAYLSSINTSFASKFNYCGKNWKLDVSQCIVKDGAYVLYLDAKGEVHRFVNFDGNRYYDERNAKTTLTYDSQGESVISDGVGNKLYFNANGYVSKSVACHSSAMVKRFTYDSGNRITSVYDERTAPKNRITFSYADGLLSAITSYVNDKQTFKITYGYDGSKNLVTVHKSAFNASLQESKKQLLAMSCAGGYLNTVTDCETKSAQRFTFKNDKICKVEQGVIREYGFALGMTDANGNPLTLGTIECGSITEKFEELDATQYAYNTESDGISVETDITNKNGITLAYFIDRNACITSSFEKTSTDGFKTLTKQGAKRTGNIAGSNSAKAVNSSNCYSTSGVLQVLNDAPFDVTRSDKEKTVRVFDYSFWLKIHNECDYLQAKATYKFKNGDVKTSTVLINGKAKDAWQKVSLPLVAPKSSDDAKTETLNYLKIGLIDNNEYYALLYDVAEIGFAPAISSTLYLTTSDGNGLPLSQADTFTLTQYESSGLVDKTYSINEATFFTENDVIATFTNKFINEGQEYFDVICNNGTKRIANVFATTFRKSAKSSANSDKPFYIKTEMPDGKTEIKTSYQYFSLHMEITTNAVRDDVSSRTAMCVDYRGRTTEETDEYDVTKKYDYNNYGDLISVKTTNADGQTGETVYYNYDDQGRLSNVHDGLNGQSLTYNEYDQLSTVTECKVSGTNLQSTPHRVQNEYDEYHTNAIQVTECDGTDIVAQNNITYKSNRIHTISDGTTKYGINYDLYNNTVEYTQFNDDKEQSIQLNSITTDDYGLQQRAILYQESDYEETKINRYGLLLNEIERDKSYKYEYYSISESDYVNKPRELKEYNSAIFSYKYDNDGELIGWKDLRDNFEVTKSGDTIEYSFGNYKRYQSVQRDSEKILSPKITGVKYYAYNNIDLMQKTPFFDVDCHYDSFGKESKKNLGEKYCHYDYSYQKIGNKTLLNEVKFQNFNGNTPQPSDGLNIKAQDKLTYTDQYDVSRKTTNLSWINQVSALDYIEENISSDTQYTYDNLHRITQEKDMLTGTITSYKYSPDGRLSKIGDKPLIYDKGRLVNYDNTTYTYDRYGSRMSKTQNGVKTVYRQLNGNKLIIVEGNDNNTICTYKYNADGVRESKVYGDGTITKFNLDGNRIIRENRNGSIYDYYYDNDGLIAMATPAGVFRCVLDSQGSVVMLLNVAENRVEACYTYDSFGNCKVYDRWGELKTDDKFVGNLNPFRWKGFYFDTETGLYYANGSYYDPQIGLYINASAIDVAVNGALTNRTLDRNGLLCNNILEFANSEYNTNALYSMPISSVTKNMLQALPSIPQWLIISTSALNSGLDFSVYVRTAWYMWRHPEIIKLMKLDGVSQLPGRFTNFINKLSYVFVTIDTLYDIYTNIHNNKSAGYVLGSAIYTAVTGIGIVWTSSIVGTKVGAIVGGHWGAIIGGIAGFVVGIGLTILSNWLKWRIFK